MSVLEENIKRINIKLQQLLKQYLVSQKENEQLAIKIKELTVRRENEFGPDYPTGAAGRHTKIRSRQNE